MIKQIVAKSKWLAGLIFLVVATFVIGGCMLANNPPVISSLTANNEGEINPGDSCQIECSASDPDGDELTYIWSTDAGNITGESDTAIWVAPDASGTYNIGVVVSDGRDGTAVEQLTIAVLAPNNPPVISSLTANNEGEINPEDSCQIECSASDPDGDELTYIWATDAGNITGEGDTVTWTAPDAPGTYTIVVEVSDGRDGTAVEQLTIEVLAPNQSPVISSLTANNEGEINPEDSFQIECSASDPDGDELTYIWSTDAGNITGEGDTVTWTAPDAPGTYTIVVEVSDGRDGTAVEQLTIEVLAINNPPVISSLTTDCPRVRPSHSAIITCVASDPDGDGLTYIWTAYDGTISGGGSTVIWTAPNEYGTYTITVTVIDGKGGEVTESISIIVCGCGSAC